MVSIVIDGKNLEVEPGSMIIEAADSVGIVIPRFCYHPKLSVAANCRMCLVEVDKAPKPLPACATPITEGMKIWTRTEKALEAQKAVMEFLLINHPLDCPICDQGGECELQDISLGFGKDIARYNEGKRVVQDKNIGPLIATDMTRCIHCTRCIRFGEEVAGMQELGGTYRGENLSVGTYIEKSLVSEVSGNIIDICPVGALTSKPYRFKARAWELTQSPSIALHDCLGSNIYVHSRNNEVMRLVPRENDNINTVWLSDRDRFSYTALSEERLTVPKIKTNGIWQEVSWEQALSEAAKRISLIAENEPEQIGVLASPNSSMEEFYLLQKLFRALNCNNIDHRLHQQDFALEDSLPLYPSLGISIKELESQEAVLLIGSNIRHEQPLASLRLRKMTQMAGKVFIINPIDFDFNFKINQKIIPAQGQLAQGLMGILKALWETGKHSVPVEFIQSFSKIKCTATDYAISEQLLQANTKVLLLGALALHHPQASNILFIAQYIAELTKARIGVLSEGANSSGAWVMGAVPHRLAGGLPCPNPGSHTQSMLKNKLKLYCLLNIEPDVDCADGALTLSALSNATTVIGLSVFEHRVLKEYCDILLPVAAFTEFEGSYMNIEGKVQNTNAPIAPLGESRPAWKILRRLATQLGVEGFAYNSLAEISKECEAISTEVKLAPNTWALKAPSNFELKEEKAFIRIAPMPLYSIDPQVRRAKPLQQHAEAIEALVLKLNAESVVQLKLHNCTHVYISNGHTKIQLPFKVDERVPKQTIWLDAGWPDSFVLGAAYSTVQVEGCEPC